MNTVPSWLEWLGELLVRLGVPEAYGITAAFALIYIVVTLILLLGILVLFRIRKSKERRRQKPPQTPPPPPAEEEREEPEADEAAQARQARETAAEAEGAEEIAPAQPIPLEPAEEDLRPANLFERMRAGLAKTQASLVGRIDGLLSGGKIDAETMEELEEILITADFGMKTTQDLIQALEKKRARGQIASSEDVREALKEEIRRCLKGEAAPFEMETARPFVFMVVGVNGVGKTTTIGKLARQFASQGKKVVLGAGDTFRAAAAEQLSIWGERAGVEVVRLAEGADPAAVAFDAAKAAVARKADVLILDTAGRLHTKVNLMEELKKVRRVLDREIPGAPHETLLVLDATTGQNALVQAKLFKEAVTVSGIALTKLDGTAKGGMVVAIGTELGLPVRYIGIGEGVNDLRPFDPDLFVEALFRR
jgi:fused signal recognition particle receptor